MVNELYAVEQVTKWFYEDMVNDILGLRRNVMLAPNGEPYRYTVDSNPGDDIINAYRRRSVEAQIRHDKTQASVSGEYCNNSKDILCKAIAALADILESIYADQQPIIRKYSYKTIKTYFKESVVPGFERLDSIYQYYRHKSKDEIVAILNDVTETNAILTEIEKSIPESKICVMYHYYRYHTVYTEKIYRAFEKVLLSDTSPHSIALLTTQSIDEKVAELQKSIVSQDTVCWWHNEIYSHTLQVSEIYPSLRRLIPSKESLKAVIKDAFKIWNQREINKGKFRSKDYNHYETAIIEEAINKILIPIPQKGCASKYSGIALNDMELRTLTRTFLPSVQVELGFIDRLPDKKDKELMKFCSRYTCPDFMIREFMQLCQDARVHMLDISKNKKSTYLDAYRDKDYVEEMVKLYISFFIIYAFDKYRYIDDSYESLATDDAEDNESQKFDQYINNSIDKSGIKLLLKYFQLLVQMKEVKCGSICTEMLEDILKNYKN